MKQFELGPIRPPSEANSLLLRVTRNCTWNQCKFCDLYKKDRFETRKIEEIMKDIDIMGEYRDKIEEYRQKDGSFHQEHLYKMFQEWKEEEREQAYFIFHWLTEGEGKAVFLQDSNSLILQADKIIQILDHLKQTFPHIERITSYGRADTLSKISEVDFVRLKKAGLNRIHSGYESGSNLVLQQIKKGTTAQEEILAGKKIKNAGIELSIYFMPGIGGKDLSKENAEETAKVINEVNPDFVRIRTCVTKIGSGLWEDIKAGKIKECTDFEKLKEIRILLEQIRACDGYFASDHIINLLPQLYGNLQTEREKMIKIIDEFFALPFDLQKEYQLARRMGFHGDWNQLSLLDRETRKEIQYYCHSIQIEKEWEEFLSSMLRRYI